MKFVTDRLSADVNATARKLVEIANAAELTQVGRIYIEFVNAALLKAGGAGEQLRAAIERASAYAARSRTDVKFTPAGAKMLA